MNEKSPQGGDGHAVTGTPYNEESFARIGVSEVWERYADRLSWGKGQCLALLDDGCDLTVPEWQVHLPWGPKVIATWNSIDDNHDPTPVPPGYHGTSVGFPSSLNYQGVCGVACNNSVAQVRCVSIVHVERATDPKNHADRDRGYDHAPDDWQHQCLVRAQPFDDAASIAARGLVAR